MTIREYVKKTIQIPLRKFDTIVQDAILEIILDRLEGVYSDIDSLSSVFIPDQSRLDILTIIAESYGYTMPDDADIDEQLGILSNIAYINKLRGSTYFIENLWNFYGGDKPKYVKVNIPSYNLFRYSISKYDETDVYPDNRQNRIGVYELYLRDYEGDLSEFFDFLYKDVVASGSFVYIRNCINSRDRYKPMYIEPDTIDKLKDLSVNSLLYCSCYKDDELKFSKSIDVIKYVTFSSIEKTYLYLEVYHDEDVVDYVCTIELDDDVKSISLKTLDRYSGIYGWKDFCGTYLPRGCNLAIDYVRESSKDMYHIGQIDRSDCKVRMMLSNLSKPESLEENSEYDKYLRREIVPVGNSDTIEDSLLGFSDLVIHGKSVVNGSELSSVGDTSFIQLGTFRQIEDQDKFKKYTTPVKDYYDGAQEWLEIPEGDSLHTTEDTNTSGFVTTQKSNTSTYSTLTIVPTSGSNISMMYDYCKVSEDYVNYVMMAGREDIEYYEGDIVTLRNTVLRGIPVSSDGNYTDSMSQQWICDTLDKNGILTRRVAQIDSYNGEDIGDIWISNTGTLDIGSTVIYKLPVEREERLYKKGRDLLRKLYLGTLDTYIYIIDEVGTELKVSYTDVDCETTSKYGSSIFIDDQYKPIEGDYYQYKDELYKYVDGNLINLPVNLSFLCHWEEFRELDFRYLLYREIPPQFIKLFDTYGTDLLPRLSPRLYLRTYLNGEDTKLEEYDSYKYVIPEDDISGDIIWSTEILGVDIMSIKKVETKFTRNNAATEVLESIVVLEPVTSVNGKTGNVVLKPEDLGLSIDVENELLVIEIQE